jgi:hypothetical protein
MPRLMDSLVTCERFGEIRLTIVRLPQDKALPVVRQNSIWGCGCWGIRHPDLLRVMRLSSIKLSERFSMSPLWVRSAGMNPHGKHRGRCWIMECIENVAPSRSTPLEESP